MRYLSTVFVSICVLPLSLAVAAEPDAKTAPAAQTSSVSAASPAAMAPAKAGNAGADASKGADAEIQIKRLRAQGYRSKTVNGVTMYCRGEIVLGSRFEKQMCGTADDLDKSSRNSKDITDDVQRRALMGSPAGK